MTRPSQARMRSPGLRVGYRPGGNLRARDIDTISRFIEYAQGIGCTIRQNGYGGMVVEVDVEPSLDTALFGIELLADRIRVHARRAVLWRYGDTPLAWNASQTDLPHSALEGEGVDDDGKDLVIVFHFDPDGGDPATIQFYDDDEGVEGDIQARLYTIHAKELLDEEEQPFDPKQYGVTLERIWRPGDVDIVPLWGDHVIEEES